MKACTKCGTTKELTEFYSNKARPDGVTTYCKSCCKEKQRAYRQTVEGKAKKNANSRKHYIKNTYGLTEQQYSEMKAACSNKCAICGKSENLGKILSVDHCHATGKVRNLLCFRCNSVLGKVEEDCDLLAKMISYLELHRHEG